MNGQKIILQCPMCEVEWKVTVPNAVLDVVSLNSRLCPNRCPIAFTGESNKIVSDEMVEE